MDKGEPALMGVGSLTDSDTNPSLLAWIADVQHKRPVQRRRLFMYDFRSVFSLDKFIMDA
jgi:hypothetical protein